MTEPPRIPPAVAQPALGERSIAAERRLRPSSIFTLYVAVFVAFCALFQMQLGHFSVLPRLRQLDPRGSRYQLLHLDYASTVVASGTDVDGVRIRARGLRLPGVALVLRADKLFAEHDCPLALPHRHRSSQTGLVIAFEAKAVRPAQATAQISDGRGSLYSAAMSLSPTWTKLRVPLREMGPGGTNFAELAGSRFLLVAFFAPSELDVSVRDLRLLLVPAIETSP